MSGQMAADAQPVIRPAAAPDAVVDLLYREKRTTGPKEAPRPNHA